MTPTPTKPRVLIATRNKHKVQEIRGILGDQWEFLTLDQFPGAPNPVEDAPDFAGNATKKAVALAEWLSQKPGHGIDSILADDSGLEVDALHGDPGVHSARFAALDTGHPGNSPDAKNNAKLLRLLETVPPDRRTARFKCVIAFSPVLNLPGATASPVCSASEAELTSDIFEGTCEGTILCAPRGQQGFGYDPLFVPNGFDQSFAELGDDIKNRISHRSGALRKLRERNRIQPQSEMECP